MESLADPRTRTYFAVMPPVRKPRGSKVTAAGGDPEKMTPKLELKSVARRKVVCVPLTLTVAVTLAPEI
jgi:hypothetical protein